MSTRLDLKAEIRKFVMENAQELLADGARVLSDVFDQSSVEERTDPGVIKEKVRAELRRFFRRVGGLFSALTIFGSRCCSARVRPCCARMRSLSATACASGRMREPYLFA